MSEHTASRHLPGERGRQAKPASGRINMYTVQGRSEVLKILRRENREGKMKLLEMT